MANVQPPRHRLSGYIKPPPRRSSTTRHDNAKHPDHRPTTHITKHPEPATIITAKHTDILYITSLARQHVNNIGFVPTAALHDHINRQSIHLLLINNEPAGYLLSSGGFRRPHRIIQVAITAEMWLQGYGAQLIAHARTTAASRPIPSVSASIRDGLPMQTVAEHTGAHLTGISTRPTARAKILTHYLWTPLHDDVHFRQPLAIASNRQPLVIPLRR